MKDKNKNLVVIKANDLIQNYKYKLTKSELRIVNMIISNISSPLYDEEFNMMTFSIKDFYTMLGWGNVGGNDYRRLKDILKRLSDTSSDYIQIGDKETIVRWIEKPYFDKKKGTVDLKLDDDLKPFLLQAKGYIQAQLKYYFEMESQYSMRIYELLKSWEGYSEKEFEVEEFRSLIDAENATYDNFGRLRQSILDPAVEEINNITDIKISYTARKTGKRFTHINFTIDKKNKKESGKSIEWKEGAFEAAQEKELEVMSEDPEVNASISDEPEVIDEVIVEDKTTLVEDMEKAEQEMIEFYNKYGVLAEEYPQFSKEQIKALYTAAMRKIDFGSFSSVGREIAIVDYISPKYEKIKATPELTKTTEFFRLLDAVEKDY